MSRDMTPLYIADLSSFAKTLRAALHSAQDLPGHQALLGVIAKAAGFQNLQHLKAATTPAAPAPIIARALRVFDASGRMQHWPGSTKLQGLCLWAFWARMPARQALTEKAVNDILKAGSLFGDHVLLRRSLIDHRLVSRKADGSEYTRIEQVPPPEALALIRAIGGQRPE